MSSACDGDAIANSPTKAPAARDAAIVAAAKNRNGAFASQKDRLQRLSGAKDCAEA